jgi:hypothetical protein
MIDVRKIRAVGKLLFRLETRSKSGSRRKLIFLMSSYLLPGIFLPLLLYKQNTDPTGFEFTFLTYLFYSLIVCFTVSSELDNLIVTQTETEIFTAMPVDDRLLVRAKMFMLVRYLLVLIIPLFTPGAVYYYFMLKSVPRSIMYFAAGFMLCYFTVNLLLLLYGMAIKTFKAKKLSSYTLVFQLILIMCMILGYQLVSYGITGKQGASAVNYMHLLQKKNLLDLFPQSWFAFLPARGHYELSFALLLKVALPVFICYMSRLSLRMYLDENFTAIKEKIFYSVFSRENDSGTQNRFILIRLISNFINTVYLKNPPERASYTLMKSMYRHDKAVKLNIIPMVIIPAGLTLFALITNQLPAPFERFYFDIKPVFHISIMLSVLVVINTSVIGMKVSPDSGASWIYKAYPLQPGKRFKNGIRKFFIIYLLLPVSIIIGIIFTFTMPLWQAALSALFIFAAANLYNSISNLLSRALPFTKENSLLNSVQKLSSMIYPFAFGTVIVIVQIFSYRNLPTAMIALLIIITLNFWVNFFGFVHVKASVQ